MKMAYYIAFVGGQNGDEGKGKIVEWFLHLMGEKLKHGGEYDGRKILAFRWQGGPNAGHTVDVKGKVTKLHQVGSGIVNPSTYCLLGKGMFLNPQKLVSEIERLRSNGLEVTPDNLGISSQAHMILEYNRIEDLVNFNPAEHTSTGNGIRQTARDKADRVGIRFIEFLDEKLTMEILRTKRFPSGFPEQFGTLEDFVASYKKERDFLAPFAVQEHEVFGNPSFNYWVGEGAQGMLLDIDDGQYPGITSSNPGLPPHRPDIIVGVYKMYVSSVGIGDRPFISEMEKGLSSKLVPEWNEYGTTTGKERHVGWFDAVAGRYAAECAHMDYIVGTCLDRLESVARLGKKLKICVAYEIDGKRHDRWDISFDRRDTLPKAVPVYEETEPWDQTVEKDGKTLTPNAGRYVKRIEELLGKEMVIVGTGPEQDEIVVRKDIFG